MRNTALAVDQRLRLHATGSGHPERPERLAVLEQLFAGPRFDGLCRVAAREASREEICRIHSAAHFDAVKASGGESYTRFDADTPASADSFTAARLAAGAAIELADAVVRGEVDNGFAALRPPGHHAERDRAMGFCLFNNAAIVARHLRHQRGLDKVLIIDWDVHHGNGTQHSFYDDPSVMYLSLHQYPFYPGSGAAQEVGAGAAEGSTVNIPMPAGAGDGHYLAAFRDIVVPAALRFAPDLVVVSAGFDAHRDDPLAMVELTTQAFAAMAEAAVAVADQCARGRLLCLLEGGYDLRALSDSVAAVLEVLEQPRGPAALDQGELPPSARESLRIHSSYWNS